MIDHLHALLDLAARFDLAIVVAVAVIILADSWLLRRQLAALADQLEAFDRADPGARASIAGSMRRLTGDRLTGDDQ